MKNIEEINSKLEEIAELKKHLKSRFIGIDNIIDQVCELIVPYHIFPDMLTRPVVINLWGMTGIGKTDLVTEIISFLKLSNKFFRFDMGEYNDRESSKLKTEFFTKTKSITTGDGVFLFDELQYANSIDKKGGEVPKSSLRPFWELIDSGKVFMPKDDDISKVFKLISSFYKTLTVKDIEIDENGYVVAGDDEVEKIFSGYGYFGERRPFDYKVVQIDKEDEKDFEEDSLDYYYREKAVNQFRQPRLMKYEFFEYLYHANPDFFGDIKDYMYHKDKLIYNTVPEYIIFLENFIKSIPAMEERDFSSSLIFIVGNVDEAYYMSGDIGNEIDPDLYYSHSLEISVTDIKKALATRFRKEQISRLGHNHIIYPSLNTESYKKIIEYYVGKKEQMFKEKTGITVEYDQSVKDLIYSDSVYPTQGVRPVMSSISNIIDSYFTAVVPKMLIKDNTVKEIKCSYSKGKLHFTGNECTISKKPVLGSDNGSTFDDDTLALVCIHECGHAFLTAFLSGLCPSKVVAQSKDSEMGGFCYTEYPDFISKDVYLNKIKSTLGGYVAEKIFFGEKNLTSGASQDLTEATSTFIRMYRKYSMDSFKGVYADGENTDQEGYQIFNMADDDDMHKKFVQLEKTVSVIITDNRQHIANLALRLFEKKVLYPEDIKEILSPLDIQWKSKDEYYDYFKILQKWKN